MGAEGEVVSTPVQRWVEVTPSQFSHESEGLNLVKALLPDSPPFRAWSNFEFRDGQGKWHEVDLLVLGRRRLHLVELKYYSGVLTGDDHRWLREGKRAEDSPLKLARRKAQRLASKLREEFIAWARESKSANIPDVRDVVPFVQECVFLHHPSLRCQLPPSSRIDLFGLAAATDSGLPPISERVLEPPTPHTGRMHDTIIAELVRRAGVVQRRQREAGSWIIDENPIAEGDGWQDWPAYHRVSTTERARIRFRVTKPGAGAAERMRVKRVVEHEYRVMARLAHDGLLRPRDLINDELGVGLVYPADEQYQRLDLWMAEQPDGLSLADQLAIIRKTAEALGYAHANRVVHRGLTPMAVQVRRTADTLKVRVGDWQAAGSATGTAETSAIAGVTAIVGAEDGNAAADRLQAILNPHSIDPDRPWSEAFEAPEGVWNRQADRPRLDVFALGALAYYVLASRPPATDRSALRDRLRRDDGLDLAADLPEVSSTVRRLVLDATRPNVSARLSGVGAFLELLDAAERELNAADTEDLDPLEAPAGSVLAGRFRIIRRLGTGSTAVGLLVTDDLAADQPHRVLKVAVDDQAGARLRDEAEVLAGLSHPRLVSLLEGPLTIGERVCLLLESAGTRTLADEIRGRRRLSLDLLERYGTDLLEALVALDKARVDHRDIKPANLGVKEIRGAKHLVLFDFSLSRAPATAVSAGTPPYLDPFLDSPDRGRFDSAAELYSAAVVLFEMATGHPPVYGDGESDPLSIPDEATVDVAEFDPVLAQPLAAFFTRALAREARARFDTAADLLAEWRAVFTALTTHVPDRDRAAAATPTTTLAEAGLSARALSALEPVGVRTVADLVAVDPVQLNRLSGVADATRREVKERARLWRDAFGPELLGRPAPAPAPGATTADVLTLRGAADQLLAAAATPRATARREVAELLLGLQGEQDAFATQGELATSLSLTRARIAQQVGQIHQAWGETSAARALLGSIAATARGALAELGGIATVAELADAVEAEFPPSPAAADGPDAARLAAGLLRCALDRLQQTRPKDDDSGALFSRRRGGRLLLMANDPHLLDLAEALAREADALVTRAQNSGEVVIPLERAAANLRPITARLIGARSAGFTDDRLVRVAVALANVAVRSGAGGLHHRDLDPARALRETLGPAPGTVAALPPTEIRDRVRTQFPALPPIPDRPRLDELLAQAGIALVFDEAARAFRAPQQAADTSGFATRGPTTHVATAVGASSGHVPAQLARSVTSRSFLALGVPAAKVDRAVQLLQDRHCAEIVDITGVLVENLRAAAEKAGVPWELVRAADAAEPGTIDAQGLTALVAQVIPALETAVEGAGAGAPPGTRPIVLVDAAPLARYHHLHRLARWTELTSSRRQAIWLVVPQMQGNTGPVLDGQSLPLTATGQFLRVDDEWIAGRLANSVPS